MEERKYMVFKFFELSEDAQKAALDGLRDINVDYEWWDCDYDDAKTVGLQIDSFDLDRNRHATGSFIESAWSCARLVIKNHGDTCETHKDAKNYLKARDQLISKNKKDENEDYEGLEELDAEFLKTMLENYSIILQHQYEYLYSDESIKSTIEANDYDFTINGKLD